MRLILSMVALAVFTSLLSGCGCSREESSVEGPGERMKDAGYTNTLARLRGDQASSAAKIAAITAKIEKLGKNASSSPEYTVLTNDLARFRAESEMIRKATQMAVRNRLMKDADKKGNLKK